jgi:hypothetical protein
MSGHLSRTAVLPGLIVAAFTFSVYSLTRVPGLTFIDSGELSTAATLLGISHPTGYPLFTLVGWGFAHLPVGPEAIVRLNVMASFYCALAAGVFFVLFTDILTLASGPKAVNRAPSPAFAPHAGAAGGTLILAFSETYWLQGTGVEVYSLHLLLVALVLLAFVRASAPGDRGQRDGRWYLFAFLLGLCFTNHMTTILLGPGLLFLYFSAHGVRGESWRRLARMSPFFLLGLTPYLYLPLRSAQNPVCNWGAPASWERFFWHVGGKQYRVWIFSSTEAAGRQFQYFVSTIPSEFAYVGLLFAVVGAVMLFRWQRRMFWGTFILFVTCVAYSINYDIHDIDSYFLLAYICVSLWAAVGMYGIVLWTARLRRGPHIAGWGIPLVCGSVVFLVNYPRVDQSSNTLVEEYTANMFASLEKNALVISYQWDFWISASYYVQYVRGERVDVAVVDKELLRRSWYLKELQVRYPWLIERSREEVEAFRRELNRFEHDLPYNPAVIQARYEKMIRSFIRAQLGDRPVYVTSEIEPEFSRGWQRVPEGLANRLYADTLFHPSPAPKWRPPVQLRKGKMEDATMRLYAEAMVHRAQYYYATQGYSEDVNQALKSALLFDANNQAARRLISALPN